LIHLAKTKIGWYALYHSHTAHRAGGVERVPDNRFIDRVANRSTLPDYCSANITAAVQAMTARMTSLNPGLFQGTQPTVCLSQEVGSGGCSSLPVCKLRACKFSMNARAPFLSTLK
jgi:hypothetical protein